jgi:ketosteroid isomerase-like protein
MEMVRGADLRRIESGACSGIWDRPGNRDFFSKRFPPGIMSQLASEVAKEFSQMKTMIRSVRRLSLFTALLVGLCGIAPAPAWSADSVKPAPCVAPEYHQLDFWIGDWDVFDVDNPAKQVARVHVERILDGCVLRENYQDTDGHKGQSFSIYDASRKRWHQSWVTNRGQVLQLDGGLQEDDMALSAIEVTADGKEKQIRGVWKPVAEGVRETALTSVDGGKNWEPWFDLMFRRHSAGNASASEDQKALAALDTEYQAAVKRNDAATMDRILADDFILVTGRGKIYSKGDLLRDARKGLDQYEHQEDTDQTVRIWGETAVVTAKLWEQGTENGEPFDYTVWFSDTYVRTPSGWRYVFGQSSLPLPKSAQ